MIDAPRPADGGSEGSNGFSAQWAWPVWSNERQHRVDAEYNGLTGKLRIHVDGQQRHEMRAWRMDLSGVEVPFEVDGRPVLFIAKGRYGDLPEADLYSDGRSLSTGELLEDRRQAAGRQMPNLVRMLIIFVPLMALPSMLRPRTGGASIDAAGTAVIIGGAVALAAAAWWLVSRWYGTGPRGVGRHLVPAAIVLGAYLGLFALFVLIAVR